MADNKEDLNKSINDLGDVIDQLADNLKPVFDFRNIEKSINALKDNIPTKGETCIHGNAWGSECSDCNEASLVDDIFELVVEYPNNSELGAKLRELYHSYNSDSDDTED